VPFAAANLAFGLLSTRSKSEDRSGNTSYDTLIEAFNLISEPVPSLLG